MNREAMAQQIKKAVTDKEFLNEILVNRYIMTLADKDAEGNNVVLKFHIVLMAIHLGMYEDAICIIKQKEGQLDRGILTGTITGNECYHSYFGIPGTGIGKTAIINYKQMFLAHNDCPEKLIRLIYKRLENNGENAKKINDKDYWHICYKSDIEDNEYMRIFYGMGYFRQMALGLLSIRSKCPEMLKHMFIKVHDRKLLMPVEGEKEDFGEYKKIIAGYTLFVHALFLCLRDDRETLIRFCQKVLDYDIKVKSQDSYINYEDEYRRYIAMIISLRPILSEVYEDDMFAGREYGHYCVVLMRIMASLYVVWTSRFKRYEPEVSRVAGSLINDIAKELKEVAGPSPLWLFRQDEGFTMGSVSGYERILYYSQLLRYACGYDLNMDATDISEFRFLSDCADDLVKRTHNSRALGKNGCQAIGRAIECLETLGVMTNMEKLKEDPKRYSENLNLIAYIADKIFEAGNMELLEVALRKNLIPEYMIQSLIAKKTEASVRMLPCLIAYKTKARRRQYEKVY